MTICRGETIGRRKREQGKKLWKKYALGRFWITDYFNFFYKLIFVVADFIVVVRFVSSRRSTVSVKNCFDQDICSKWDVVGEDSSHLRLTKGCFRFGRRRRRWAFPAAPLASRLASVADWGWVAWNSTKRIGSGVRWQRAQSWQRPIENVKLWIKWRMKRAPYFGTQPCSPGFPRDAGDY